MKVDQNGEHDSQCVESVLDILVSMIPSVWNRCWIFGEHDSLCVESVLDILVSMIPSVWNRCWIFGEHDSLCVESVLVKLYLSDEDISWMGISHVWYHMHSVSLIICIGYNMIGWNSVLCLGVFI